VDKTSPVTTGPEASIPAALDVIRQRIAAACERTGRAATEVSLLAVSKRQPPSALVAAFAAGQHDFGENYAQELRDKAADARLAEARFHAIGPLQTNKARYVAEHAVAFHALDRLDVARELDKQRSKRNKPPLLCFIEVNVAGEASKHGVAPADVLALRDACQGLGSLHIGGLMCMPPLADAPEASRPHFAALRALAKQVSLPLLSMGSTDDFEVAIEEGATHVRVGRAIFGERDQPQ
jgi:pyridoxal phosphate enzyme (YggS family)